jgi:MOSC domain-containing protein YiiM
MSPGSGIGRFRYGRIPEGKAMTPTEPEIGRVISIQVGAIAPLGPDGTPSAFVKRLAPGPVEVRPLGLVGDAQADLRVHGGPDKAVYGYAVAHYSAWASDFPEHAAKLQPGAFGENLTIDGLVEDDLCVGDVHMIGSARLQVCQPRLPCFKFALRFEDPLMPRHMVRNGRSGWYYRVLEGGVLTAGDLVRLAERPNPGFPFARLVAIAGGGRASVDELVSLSKMDGLAGGLKAKARRALNPSIHA